MMLTEVEDNMADWLEQEEADVHGKEGIADIAAEALERFSEQLGEKTMVSCSLQIIMEGCGKADNWQYRQAGFVYLGMIAEACEKHFQKFCADTVQLIARGMQDPEPRVRYQAIMALGLQLNVASPTI